MLRIAVTGAVGSGKTTLVRKLSVELARRGHSVMYSCEAALETIKDMAGEGESAGDFLRRVRETEDVLSFQREVLRRHMEAEAVVDSYNPKIALIDRTWYDWLYFFLRDCGKFFHSEVAVECSRMFAEAAKSKRYDGVLFCEPVNSDGLNDGRRAEKDLHDREIQRNIILGLVRLTGVPYVQLSGGVEERVKKAAEFVESLLSSRGAEIL